MNILNEIVALGPMRLQEVWGFSHTVVLELYASGPGRLYLINDFSSSHPTFHLQPHKPLGHKVVTPLVLALRKHALNHALKFERVDGHESMLRATVLAPDTEICVIFDLSPRSKMGLFSGTKVLATAKPGDVPELKPGAPSAPRVSTSLASHLAQASMYEQSMSELRQREAFQTRRQFLTQSLKKKLALLQNLRTDLQKCHDNLEHEHDAELMRVNLHVLKKGMDQVLLTDYSTDPPQQKLVLLDRRLSPQQSLEKIFNLIKRARRGISHISPRLFKLEVEVTALKQALAEFDLAGPAGMKLSPPQPSSKPPLTTTKHKAAKRLPYRIFVSSDNIPLWVGKSAKDNDALTLHHARGNEWWFHVREGTGSHVVVKCSDDALKSDTMLEAAMLAAHFSAHKNDSSPEVIYTRIKHIKKPKGLSPGQVRVEQEKSMIVRMDQDRVGRMLTQG